MHTISATPERTRSLDSRNPGPQIDRRLRVLPIYQFHHKVHETWGKRALHFWLFGFGEAYERQDVLAALARVLEEHDVTAHATYELMGQYDLLLRVWLPFDRFNSFGVSLRTALDPFSLTSDVSFTVQDHVRHWPWASGHSGRGPIRPTKEVAIAQLQDALAHRPPDHVLRELNQLTRCHDGALPPSLTGYRDSNIITEVPHGSGVKLVTLISPTRPVPNRKRVWLQRQIAKILDDSDPTLISECSFYGGTGSGLFLIMCRIDPARFSEVREAFIDKLQIPLTSEARTTTYPVLSQELLPYVDAIPLDVAHAPDEPDAAIRDLLLTDESQTVEVKATAFAPIDPWLRGEGDLEETEATFDRGVLKAVTGLLNAQGGTIVVGALESERYRGLSKAVDARLATFPSIGQYVCCGLLDPTFTQHGWDHFSRKLIERLESRITPAPAGHVRATKETLQRTPLCVIRVSAPSHDEWFYAQPNASRPAQFYVRQGPRTVELHGTDADRYKKHLRAERAEQSR